MLRAQPGGPGSDIVATVTRAQETQKTEVRLKRNNYQKIYIIKENKETISFIYFNLEK
jgi:hypothetical protein